MTIPLVNSALPAPEGADGQVHRVVALCLQRVVPQAMPGPTAALQPADPYGRSFDLAELLAWACTTAGVRPVPPNRSDLLLMYCRAARTTTDVAAALTTKGALVFGADASLGVCLGSRNRVIVQSTGTGVVVDSSGARRWSHGARIPGARGYRP